MKISKTFWANAPKQPIPVEAVDEHSFDEGTYVGLQYGSRKYRPPTRFYHQMVKLMGWPERLSREEAISIIITQNRRELAAYKEASAAWVKALAAYIASFGPHKTGQCAGGIGEGDKIHNLTVEYVDTPDGAGILRASSHCGSQKWNVEHPSGLSVNEAPLNQVNCDRCLGKKTPGGKQPPQYKCGKCGRTGSLGSFVDTRRNWTVRRYLCPGCNYTEKPDPLQPGKRPVIDPMSRPRTFHFSYKLERENGYIEERRDSAKGMSEEQAWKKIDTLHRPWYGRVFDQKVICIWSFNNKLLWKES